MKIISIYNNKGGAAKTTTAFHLGQGLALTGHTVLLIDNDQQLSLSQGCLSFPAKTEGLAQIYQGKKIIEEVAQEAENISIRGENTLVVVPGNIELMNIMEDVGVGAARFENLGEALKSETIQDAIDYVIIDNSPFFKGPSEYSIKICDEIFIPCPPSKTDFEGLVRTIGMIKNMGDEYYAKISKIIPSIVKRTAVATDYLEQMRENFGDLVVNNVVVETADVPKVIDKGKVVYLTKYTSNYAKNMLNLIAECFPEIDRNKTTENILEAIKTKRIKRMFDNFKKKKESELSVIQEFAGKGA